MGHSPRCGSDGVKSLTLQTTPHRFTTNKAHNWPRPIITPSSLLSSPRPNSLAHLNHSRTLHLLTLTNLQTTRHRSPLVQSRAFRTPKPPLPPASILNSTLHGSLPNPMDRTHRPLEGPRGLCHSNWVFSLPEFSEVILLNSRPTIHPSMPHPLFPCRSLPILARFHDRRNLLMPLPIARRIPPT